MGLKVGLKQSVSATGPSPFGSMGLGTRQVMTKTQTIYQVGLSVLHHSAKSNPTTCLPNRTPTPTTTMVKSSLPSLFRMTTRWPTMPRHHLLWCHPLALAQHHSLSTAPSLRVPRVGLPAPVSAQGPHHPLPYLHHLDVGGQDPLLQHLAGLQILPKPDALLSFIHHLL